MFIVSGSGSGTGISVTDGYGSGTIVNIGNGQGSGENVVVGDGHVQGIDIAGDNGELSGTVSFPRFSVFSPLLLLPFLPYPTGFFKVGSKEPHKKCKESASQKSEGSRVGNLVDAQRQVLTFLNCAGPDRRSRRGLRYRSGCCQRHWLWSRRLRRLRVWRGHWFSCR